MQRGQVRRRIDRAGWEARWHERGRRRTRGGFKTSAEAKEWLEKHLRALRTGMLDRPVFTLEGLAERYVAQHQASASRLAAIEWGISKWYPLLGADTLVSDLAPDVIGAARKRLPERQRHQATQTLRQLLGAAVRWGAIAENPAAHVRNPKHARVEIMPFESWGQLQALAEELGEYGAIPIFGAGTGLRPEEWIPLERRDLDRDARVVIVRRTYSEGRLVEFGGKTAGSIRRVPLRQVVLDMLDELPRRLDQRLLFPGPRGDYLHLRNWRRREWKPAILTAGIVPGRRPYDLRHTYATWSIAAGVNIYQLARRMGTSVDMIDHTYGHLAPNADAYEAELLDEYDRAQIARVTAAQQEAIAR